MAEPVTRPAPPRPARPGFEYAAVPDPRWRLVTGKRCRWGTGPGKPACRAPSVAEFNRSREPGGRYWYAYCGSHLYGRWVEDGQVMVWILRRVAGNG